MNGLKQRTEAVRIITELQYYDDGSADVIRSFCIPINRKPTKKETIKNKLSLATEEGQTEL